MIKKLLPFILLALTLMSCDKKNEFDFDYKIIVSYIYSNQFLHCFDNKLVHHSYYYYYDNNKKLLRVGSSYGAADTPNGYCPIEYYNDFIENVCGEKYFFDANGQITSIENSNITELEYESGKIIYKKERTNDNIVIREDFYKYENGNLIKDSTVIYQNSIPYTAVHEYEYTDTTAKNFMVDYPGLYEMQLQSKNLLRKSYSSQSGILYEYSYDIYENEIIQYVYLYDTFHNNSKMESWATRYKLKKINH